MSALTSSDVRGLMEAYQAVYAPQELTEEQVWEEVENWVNSLLKEGYDLSDYTWEEMYEAYIEEVAVPNVPNMKEQGKNFSFFGDFNKSAEQLIGKPGQKPTPKPDKPSDKPSDKPLDKPSDQNQNRNRNLAANNPAPRPSGTTSTPKPAPKPATGPATGMLGKTSFERRTPTSAELKAAQAARAGQKAAGEDTSTVANAEKALQAAKAAGTASKVQSAGQAAGAKAFSSPTAGAAAFKSPAFNPTPTPARSGFGVSAAPLAAKSSTATATAAPEVKATNTAAATPKPTPVAPKLTPRQQRLNMEMEYDAYDLVLEYLLSQGHTDTVEEANYVMLEMDSEMIQSICEAEVDKRYPEHERSGIRLARYDNPSGALALGGGQQRARREEHEKRRGKKKVK